MRELVAFGIGLMVGVLAGTVIADIHYKPCRLAAQYWLDQSELVRNSAEGEFVPASFEDDFAEFLRLEGAIKYYAEECLER